MNAGEAFAAGFTRHQTAEYSAALDVLRPLGVSLLDAAHAVANALNLVPDLSGLEAAVKQFARRSQQVVRKPVAEVVNELIKVKRKR